jgi:hypothetical protein
MRRDLRIYETAMATLNSWISEAEASPEAAPEAAPKATKRAPAVEALGAAVAAGAAKKAKRAPAVELGGPAPAALRAVEPGAAPAGDAAAVEPRAAPAPAAAVEPPAPAAVEPAGALAALPEKLRAEAAQLSEKQQVMLLRDYEKYGPGCENDTAWPTNQVRHLKAVWDDETIGKYKKCAQDFKDAYKRCWDIGNKGRVSNEERYEKMQKRLFSNAMAQEAHKTVKDAQRRHVKGAKEAHGFVSEQLKELIKGLDWMSEMAKQMNSAMQAQGQNLEALQDPGEV